MRMESHFKYRKQIIAAMITMGLTLLSTIMVGCSSGGHHAVGLGNSVELDIPVFTNKEMLMIAFLNQSDRRYFGDRYDLFLERLSSSHFQVRRDSGTRLVEFEGNLVTFFNNSNINQSVVALDGPLFVNGTILEPSLGVNGNGDAFFPITFAVEPFGSFVGSIPGNGRVVDDFFFPIFDPDERLFFTTLFQESTAEQGEIISGNKVYGTYRLEFNSSFDPTNAEALLVLFEPPLFR